jgi:hypothetical protein
VASVGAPLGVVWLNVWPVLVHVLVLSTAGHLDCFAPKVQNLQV